MDFAVKNSHSRDSKIEFFKESHQYKITRDNRTEFAPVSVTSFCKRYFTQFNPRRTVDLYFYKWKCNPNSKYYATIQTAFELGYSEEQAKKLIMDMWVRIGNKASDKGTDMHERAENVCNGVCAPDEDKEMALLVQWQQEFQPQMQWQTFRTEWMLWWDEPLVNEAVLVAGTLDLLLKSTTTGEFALVDFKRTNPNPKYEGGPLNLLGPCENSTYHPGYATSPLVELEDSKYGTYCMQLNILAKILRERYEIDVGHNMYLLQLHVDMDRAHCIRVPSHTQATNTLFRIEAERAVAADTFLYKSTD